MNPGQILSLVTIFALTLLATPLAAEAPPAGKVPRIGLLALSAAPVYAPDLAAFRQRLRELGYVEGQNVVIEDRYAEARVERLAVRPRASRRADRVAPMRLVLSEPATGVWLQLEGDTPEEWASLEAIAASGCWTRRQTETPPRAELR